MTNVLLADILRRYALQGEGRVAVEAVKGFHVVPGHHLVIGKSDRGDGDSNGSKLIAYHGAFGPNGISRVQAPTAPLAHHVGRKVAYHFQPNAGKVAAKRHADRSQYIPE